MPLLGDKGNKFKVDPPKIRIERVAVERPSPQKPKPPPGQTRPRPAGASSSARSSLTVAQRPSPRPDSARPASDSPHLSSADERRRERKRKQAASAPPPRPSPARDRVACDKDSDNEDDGWMTLDARKRQRRGTADGRFDPNRRLRNSRAFEGRNNGLQFIHAVQVASLEAKCVPVMGAQKEDVAVELQYPSLQPRERYARAWRPCM